MQRGARVAQSVKCLTFDFGSGHDFTVREIEPSITLHTDRAEPAWDSLFPSLSAPLPFTLSLKINIKKIFLTFIYF